MNDAGAQIPRSDEFHEDGRMGIPFGSIRDIRVLRVIRVLAVLTFVVSGAAISAEATGKFSSLLPLPDARSSMSLMARVYR